MTESKEVKYMGGQCLSNEVGGSANKHAMIGPDLYLTHKGAVPTPHEGAEEYLGAL